MCGYSDGVKRVYDYNASLSAQTKLYGMYTPGKYLVIKCRLSATSSPEHQFSYRPDFSDPRFNFYETYSYKNEYGEV